MPYPIESDLDVTQSIIERSVFTGYSQDLYFCCEKQPGGNCLAIISILSRVLADGKIILKQSGLACPDCLIRQFAEKNAIPLTTDVVTTEV